MFKQRFLYPVHAFLLFCRHLIVCINVSHAVISMCIHTANSHNYIYFNGVLMRAQRSEHKIYAAVVRSIVLYHVLRISLTERLRTCKVV